MSYNRGRIAALSFVLLSIGSAIYVSAATLNYLGLYPALDEVQVQLVSLSFLQNQNINQSSLTALVNVSNPTSYSGLRIGDIRLTLYFNGTNSNETLFTGLGQLTARQVISDQLPPNSAYTANVPVPLTSQQATQLVSFINQHKNNVIGVVFLTVDVTTFLEVVTGPVPYVQTQKLPLSSG